MISVICPVYNEEKFIPQIINFFNNSKPYEKELIFIDGGSTDDTINKIKSFRESNKNIHLLHNPNKYVPFALNLALKAAKGEIIIRIDAHSYYAEDYFEKILETFNTVEADVVGGPARIHQEEGFRAAAGFVVSHPFGIGNSKIHVMDFRGYTDHVQYGAWRKELFKEIGYFDERLIRDQDEEFHYRAKSLGKKIFLNPDIKVWYVPRGSYGSFFKQYFQYGFYKPIVLRKIKSEIKLRHLIPSLFVIYLILCPFALYFPIILMPLILYILIVAFVSITSENTFINKLRIMVLFPLIHLAYGTGMISGIKNLLKKDPAK